MTWLYLLIIFVTIIGIAVGHYPGLRMNRATISFVGAALLVSIGAISLKEAYASIDMNTITLLLAVMIINVNLNLSGFFKLIGSGVVKWAKTPAQLLFWVILSSGLLSALFLNDIIVLMFTPLILDVTMTFKRNPIPYLIGLATAANIGSTATITGNPQNMIIGIASNIPFVTFTAYLFPIAFGGLLISWLIIVIIYRHEFIHTKFQKHPELKVRIYKPLFVKSIVSAVIMLFAFIYGIAVPLAALLSASILLITRRLKPERVFREIDWSLLVFFSGLFVITGSIETTGITESLFRVAKPVAENGIIPLTAVSAALSNLVSNVPAVLLFRPFINYFPNPQKSWLVLAMATTLAGNLTILGSVANLIVAESAKKRGINLSFLEYLKSGLPITIISLVIGVLWLTFKK